MGWENPEKRKLPIHNVPQHLLKVDTWVYGEVGDLCITDRGCLDEIKKIVWVSPKEPFNGHHEAIYKHSKKRGRDYYLVTVKKGKVFKRWGKTFKYKKETETEEQP